MRGHRPWLALWGACVGVAGVGFLACAGTANLSGGVDPASGADVVDIDRQSEPEGNLDAGTTIIPTPDVVVPDAASPTPTCSTTQRDCNARPEDGCETDTTTAATDCGACGRSCGKGECLGGKCLPFVLATNSLGPLGTDGTSLFVATLGFVRRVAKDGTTSADYRLDFSGHPTGIHVDRAASPATLFLSTLGTLEPPTGTIVSLRADDGGAPLVRAQNQDGPERIAGNAGFIVWLTNGIADPAFVDAAVLEKPKAGGATEAIAQDPDQCCLAADSQAAYFARSGQIIRAPFGAGTNTAVGPGSSFVVENDTLYYTRGAELRSIIPTIATSDKLIVTTGGAMSVLATDNTSIYLFESTAGGGFGGTLKRVPKIGGAIEAVTQVQGAIRDLIVDDSALYWIDSTNLVKLVK